jgi:hypothetical protein
MMEISSYTVNTAVFASLPMYHFAPSSKAHSVLSWAYSSVCGSLAKGLAHMAKRYFNDEGVRRTKGMAYELSKKTQQELHQIGAALTAGREAGNAEVQVRWVWDPVKAIPWPDKLY